MADYSLVRDEAGTILGFWFARRQDAEDPAKVAALAMIKNLEHLAIDANRGRYRLVAPVNGHGVFVMFGSSPAPGEATARQAVPMEKSADPDAHALRAAHLRRLEAELPPLGRLVKGIIAMVALGFLFWFAAPASMQQRPVGRWIVLVLFGLGCAFLCFLLLGRLRLNRAIAQFDWYRNPQPLRDKMTGGHERVAEGQASMVSPAVEPPPAADVPLAEPASARPEHHLGEEKTGHVKLRTIATHRDDSLPVQVGLSPYGAQNLLSGFTVAFNRPLDEHDLVDYLVQCGNCRRVAVDDHGLSIAGMSVADVSSRTPRGTPSCECKDYRAAIRYCWTKPDTLLIATEISSASSSFTPNRRAFLLEVTGTRWRESLDEDEA